MNDVRVDDRDKMQIDLDKLSERDLEELTRIVVKKLRAWMQQERDRSGLS